MSKTSRPTAAFFTGSTFPSPPLPLLTAQTDVLFDQGHPAKLLAQEEVRPATVLALRKPRSTTHDNVPYTKPKPIRFTTPGAKPVSRDADSDEDDESSTSLSESESSSDSEKVLKPLGEPGRPRTGGYNIENAMGWKPAAFAKLKVCHRFFKVHI
jgi:hypothetical protein